MNEKIRPSEIAKILIVDDLEANLLALEGWLENPELKIVKASSGNQALGLMLEEDFALVLLDVQMPEMDGFETAELMRLSEKTRNVPVIFVTAISQDRKHVFKGYTAGAVDYLSKPLDPDILRAKVSVFLQLYRQRRSLEVIADELNRALTSLEEANEQLKSEIVSRKLAEEALESLSLRDELTGLYNRRGFITLAEQALKSAQRSGSRMLLIFGDLDNMKGINDALGHKTGDQALIELAHILKENFRESDIIARIGGDEFVILVQKNDEISAEKLIRRFEKGLKEHSLQNERPYSLSMSMGIACFDPQSPCSIDILLARADKLMYENKQKKRSPLFNNRPNPDPIVNGDLYHPPVIKKTEKIKRYEETPNKTVDVRLSAQD